MAPISEIDTGLLNLVKLIEQTQLISISSLRRTHSTQHSKLIACVLLMTSQRPPEDEMRPADHSNPLHGV